MTDKDKVIHIDIVDVGTLATTTETNLLKALESAGVHIHYHCREGFCGACRTKLLDGDVTYSTDPLAFIDDDEILPCCCNPNGPLKIKVPL
ncbi:class I ribonucleotide reductase maintenance protein YfaE [Alteromonas sp. KUL49]|uniref:class I ribonucleotide reductase maintenance protein YfaE n=1 Tax=Alteromonas sp. KUL49 TaxID=2480798 RepID=UPI00102F0AA8|nr:class I ribonucleotide reductase maintenance protein YfaE [Alteromonas sp. KUL49]TAP40738.1 2Fe-2S ferredoxin-like protein [Alteromonas sp. KUL49]GEA10906.1 (2Fe-2S) ferredoxin [Alteromonas sp. KUL49]